MNPNKIRIACISDSPKLTTGFAGVARMMYQGLYDYGFDISAFGLLDVNTDTDGVLPYPFTPVSPMNLMGHSQVNGQLMYSLFLRRVKPHLIFIITSPGNAKDFINGIYDGRVADYKVKGQDFTPPVLLYTPIEGRPQHSSHGIVFAKVQALGGKVVAYCESAKQQIMEEFPGIEPEVVYHGHDHANFRRYSDEDRSMVRKVVGLDDYFVVGAVGTNKRTKNWPMMIYTARQLRDKGLDKGILFYCHTDEKHSYMEGMDLGDLATAYGVRDMFLFKPDGMIERNHPYLGVEYEGNTLKQVKESGGQVPRNRNQRAYLFGHYDLITRYNCMDMYLDISQVEGWGLPPCEAMMCGVPTVSVRDGAVRDEIYTGSTFMLDPIDKNLWETWSTGARLLQVDPAHVAMAIYNFKQKKEDSPALYKKWGLNARESISRYKWSEESLKMAKIAHSIVDKDQENG